MNKFMKKIMSKKDGFTLVELIVVIAILAILAGVAVPVYSGYIKNANEAADNQVVEAVETALTAALSMNGKDWSVVDDFFTVTFENDKTLKVVSKTDDNSTLDEEMWKDFCTFAGVATTSSEYESTAMKAYTTLAEVETGAVIDFTP